MLTQLQIRDFTLIEQADIELGDGMTSLTGETGAGKSILLDAIGLVLGDRADSSSVRPGSKRAEITAVFQLDATAPVWRWLHEHDLEDDDHCLLRRIVAAEGKSRGYINGTPVSMHTLREVGEMLVDIHGQHEHYALSQRATHRELLDSMAKSPALVRQVNDCYLNWRTLQDKISSLTEDSHHRAQRIDMLRFQVQEFEQLRLDAEELRSIEAEHKRSANAGQLLELASSVLNALDDADASADTQLQSAARIMQQLHALDPGLDESMEIINTASILVQEASASVRDYVNHMDIDGDRLQYLDERLANLHRLAKKHQCDIADLLGIQQRLEQELAEIDNEGNSLETLQTECDALLKLYDTQAQKLGRQRKKSAQALSQSVSAAMHALGMPGGEFVCQVETEAAPQSQPPSRHGRDTVRFLVSPNPGMQPGDISKIASGGELSRISLALALTTRRKATTPTLIFDEVDSGIGGAVAATVGEYLHELGGKAQVLCVTHLPQVAAKADHHLRVSKQVVNGKTSTQLTPLEGADTVDEIARMLGGAKVTRKSRQHALEMLGMDAGVV